MANVASSTLLDRFEDLCEFPFANLSRYVVRLGVDVIEHSIGDVSANLGN
jgi:hypothetical protein